MAKKKSTTKKARRASARKRSNGEMRTTTLRRQTVTAADTSTSTFLDVVPGKDSTCVMCAGTLPEHFGANGDYTGCIEQPNGQTATTRIREVWSRLLQSDVKVFLPPVMLNATASGGQEVATIGAAIPSRRERRAIEETLSHGARGRRPENIFPTVKSISSDLPENTTKVFKHLLKYAKTGVTLKEFTTSIRMPYSTVQAQVNKLVAMNAAKKQAVDLAKKAA